MLDLGLSGVEPPRRTLSEIDEEVVNPNSIAHLELHLVDVIELGAEANQFRFRVEGKNLCGNSFAIIEPDYLDGKLTPLHVPPALTARHRWRGSLCPFEAAFSRTPGASPFVNSTPAAS